MWGSNLDFEESYDCCGSFNVKRLGVRKRLKATEDCEICMRVTSETSAFLPVTLIHMYM